jgi:hypothetical protein
LLEEPYILVGPHGTILPRRVEDFAAYAGTHPFVRYTQRSRTGRDIERHLRRLRSELSRGQEFDTPYGVAAAVAAGRGWAITTALCLFEAALPLDAFDCDALPGPAFLRRLLLIARGRELGELPHEIAGTVREALRAGALPMVAAGLPWAAARMAIAA